MVPLVLDPVVVVAIEKACADFLRLQRPAQPALPPVSERETSPPAAREIARAPFELS